MYISWRHTHRSLTVGIDIDVNTIKLVALRRKRVMGHVFELVSYAHRVTTPESPLINEAVRNVLQQAGINKKSKIVIALPYGQVLIKTIRLDAVCNLVELENNIIAHCEEIITYPIHEACIDFEVVEDRDVRVVIARRNAVEEKINLFSASEFTIAAVDVESDALARCIHYVLSQEEGNYRQRAIIAMHIAAQKILGLVIHQGKILFSQEIVICVTDTSGINSDNYLEKVKILFPILDLSAKNFLKMGSPLLHIDKKIYLSGSQFFSDEFIEQISQITRKQCCLVNPFLSMDKKRGVSMKDLEKYAQSLVISCGLAMRDSCHGY